MKQTVVEWLFEQIENRDRGEIPMWIYNFYYEAIEMEKEQIIDTYTTGLIDPLIMKNYKGLSVDEIKIELKKTSSKILQRNF